MILGISESFTFSLNLLIENSFIFKQDFFTYFEYFSGGIIRKDILHSDYHSARWYWCKKDQKNLPQTSHTIFPECLIVNPLFLWAFTVESFCKNPFSGVKVEKGHFCNKNNLLCQKSPRITGFYELTPKVLSILTGLILHRCDA